MKLAAGAARLFISDSDDYQRCLLRAYSQLRSESIRSENKQPLDPLLAPGVDALLDRNQEQKKEVGAQINEAITEYKERH